MAGQSSQAKKSTKDTLNHLSDTVGDCKRTAQPTDSPRVRLICPLNFLPNPLNFVGGFAEGHRVSTCPTAQPQRTATSGGRVDYLPLIFSLRSVFQGHRAGHRVSTKQGTVSPRFPLFGETVIRIPKNANNKTLALTTISNQRALLKTRLLHSPPMSEFKRSGHMLSTKVPGTSRPS